MAIDPLTSLAFTVHSNPGTYAVLLGSGVSTGAGIPTGWSIVLDLIRQLAQLEGEKPSEDELEQWYIDKHDSAPEYTVLLEALTKTPAERQGILSRDMAPTGVDDQKLPAITDQLILCEAELVLLSEETPDDTKQDGCWDHSGQCIDAVLDQEYAD